MPKSVKFKLSVLRKLQKKKVMDGKERQEDGKERQENGGKPVYPLLNEGIKFQS